MRWVRMGATRVPVTPTSATVSAVISVLTPALRPHRVRYRTVSWLPGPHQQEVGGDPGAGDLRVLGGGALVGTRLGDRVHAQPGAEHRVQPAGERPARVGDRERLAPLPH